MRNLRGTSFGRSFSRVAIPPSGSGQRRSTRLRHRGATWPGRSAASRTRRWTVQALVIGLAAVSLGLISDALPATTASAGVADAVPPGLSTAVQQRLSLLRYGVSEGSVVNPITFPALEAQVGELGRVRSCPRSFLRARRCGECPPPRRGRVPGSDANRRLGTEAGLGVPFKANVFWAAHDGQSARG